MYFGPVRPEEATGAILAHSLRAGGVRLRKGTLLDAAQVEALAGAGVAEVIVARLEPGDVGEDPAATALARSLVPDPAAAGLRLTEAATGRVNLYATGPGVLVYDVARIHALNAADPMITLAVLPPLAAVAERTLAGTVKVIAYGVAEAALERACAAARGGLRVAPPVLRRATLIETEVPGPPLSEKGARAVAGRLGALGVELAAVRRVPHAVDPLSEALREAEGGPGADPDRVGHVGPARRGA